MIFCFSYFPVLLFFLRVTFLYHNLQMKLVTPSALVERLKINSSLARAACKFLAEEGKIQPVEVHNKQRIYTRVNA